MRSLSYFDLKNPGGRSGIVLPAGGGWPRTLVLEGKQEHAREQPGARAPLVIGDAKVRAMPGSDGVTLLAWRRSRRWDVPELARQLRRASGKAGVQIAAHDGLIRMIYAWERGDHEISERYELLYRALGFAPDLSALTIWRSARQPPWREARCRGLAWRRCPPGSSRS